MAQFDIISPDLLQVGIEVEGIKQFSNFDVLTRTIGAALTNKFLAEYPDYPVDPLDETLFPPVYKRSRHSGEPTTVTQRFEDFPDPDSFFAHTVSPTTPEHIRFLRGYVANTIMGVTVGKMQHCVETRVFLEAKGKGNYAVSARKRISPHPISFNEDGLDAHIEKLTKPRINSRSAINGISISSERYNRVIALQQRRAGQHAEQGRLF